MEARWIVVTILDLLLEGLILAIPTWLIIPLSMDSTRKVQVLSSFFFRLPLVAFSILHVVSTISYSAPSTEYPSYAITLSVIWALTQTAWAIFAASMPALFGFIQSFDTSCGNELIYSLSTLPNSLSGRATFGYEYTHDGGLRYMLGSVPEETCSSARSRRAAAEMVQGGGTDDDGSESESVEQPQPWKQQDDITVDGMDLGDSKRGKGGGVSDSPEYAEDEYPEYI